MTFMDLLSADHHAIDADFYRQLAEVFTAAQIIELGFAARNRWGCTASSTRSRCSAPASR